MPVARRMTATTVAELSTSQPDDVIWPLGLVAQGIPTVRITAPASATAPGAGDRPVAPAPRKARMVKNAHDQAGQPGAADEQGTETDMACSSARPGATKAVGRSAHRRSACVGRTAYGGDDEAGGTCRGSSAGARRRRGRLDPRLARLLHVLQGPVAAGEAGQVGGRLRVASG